MFSMEYSHVVRSKFFGTVMQYILNFKNIRSSNSENFEFKKLKSCFYVSVGVVSRSSFNKPGPRIV
ncbi:hypothetical protein SAMN04488514_101582 [Kriegella aquimaris]|uniref:Uncharacterized protein n=1 Tax=Kriegella aquimaris TaxID=192904 RepID=A0A1G9JKH8_9FLAO|nr:hypothetical protein SAMN04488514_101582 [Kriegella aquimaris]